MNADLSTVFETISYEDLASMTDEDLALLAQSSPTRMNDVLETLIPRFEAMRTCASNRSRVSHGYSQEDTIANNLQGLHRAVETYDAARGAAFSTHAYSLIMRYSENRSRHDQPLRDQRIIRKGKPETVLSVCYNIDKNGALMFEPSSYSDSATRLSDMNEALSHLDPDIADILMRRLGCGEDVSSLAKETGISSREVVSRINAGLEKIRKLMGVS